jgi:phospholipid transport system substrate-binding protein
LSASSQVGTAVANVVVNLNREWNMIRSSVLSTILLAVLLALVPASAFADGTDAEQFVKDRHNQLTELLQKPKDAIREKRVGSSIDEVFDYQQLAARSLGDEWQNRSDAERQQFRELLEKLVRQSYRKSIDSTLGYKVEQRGIRKSGEDTIVATIAKHKTDNRKAQVSIDYVLVQVDGKWRAVDVIIEGSSLVGNYRSQFARIIKKSGFAELITKLKRKIEKGEK